MARACATIAVLAFNLLVGWVAFSSLYVVFPNMVLLEKCAALGVVEGQCTSAHPDFLQAQLDQTAFLSMYTLLSNLPYVIMCAFYAHLSDCVGRKPLAVLMAVQGCVTSALIMWQGLARTEVVAIVIAMSFLSSSIYGSTGNGMAAAADVMASWSDMDRARVFSVLESAIWIGQLIGPPFGGVVSNIVGPQHSMVVSLGLGALGLLSVLVLQPETLPQERRLAFTWGKANPFGGLLVARKFPTCFVLAGGMLFAQLAISSGVTLWPLYCKREFLWSDGTIGALESVFFAANAVGLMVVMPFMASCIEAKSILMMAGASAVVMWSLFAVAKTGWQFFAIACIGALNAMMYPVLRTSMVGTLGPQLYGAALGLLALVELTCQMSGPALANELFHVLELNDLPDNISFAVSATLLLVALTVFVFVPRSDLTFERSARVQRACEAEEADRSERLCAGGETTQS